MPWMNKIEVVHLQPGVLLDGMALEELLDEHGRAGWEPYAAISDADMVVVFLKRMEDELAPQDGE